MVRGKGKVGKKQMDIGSEDEKKVVPVQRRRGRPLKSLKGEVQEKEVENVGDSENAKSSISISTSNELKNSTTVNGRKRKRSSIVKETPPADSNGGEKNGADNDDSSRTVGFRQNGSRRKNKPRRAAEVGVECN
ncbi:uncharacterized protein LOC124942440 [Impatiens glandulifera]|uniref:uncharacterized protein LOC124942440 n=1 Tax=Impatiens glandulifera TaxID=253017 RepID=UPI001FB1572E|nr:uncharacterized protein LOC124942440 [Impatiens glandulifera]XP_047338909.1 uncharacterized protein LOC124942440 [Impatiens glandulifera]XP_047338910.1 uncharacterized protein LOC124942440 [Impatiens glandulifera]